MNKHNQIWWQLTVLLVVSALAVYTNIKLDQEIGRNLPEATTFTSTFNMRPSGYSGFWEIARRTGLSCKRWQFPYRQLRAAHGTLVIIGPNASLESHELDQVLDWLKSGNRLIYLDDFALSSSRSILQKLGMNAHTGTSFSDTIVPGQDSNQGYFAHVGSVCVATDTSLTGGHTLLSSAKDTLLATVPCGKGTVVVGTIPSLCANRHLSQPKHWANFQFLVNLLATGDGEILFDEFCHGYSQSTNVFVYLAKTPAGPLFLQGLLLLILAVAGSWQRFGSTVTIKSARKISNLEFIHGLANTYRRAGATDLALDILNHSLVSALCKALSIAPQQGPEKLAHAWSQATGRSASQLSDFLASSASALEKRTLTDEELMSLCRSCDKIREQSKDLLATRRSHHR